MIKKNIAVIFGSRSAEHDVSIITAHIPIMNTLKTMPEYNIVPVYIAKNGSWYSFPGLSDINTFTDSNFANKLRDQKKLQLLFDNGLELVTPGIRPKKTKIDVAFPATHGTYGEDGSLMGLLRMANVPFVGCDMAASAVAMDKVWTRFITEKAGIEGCPYVWFNAGEFKQNKNEIVKKINKFIYPVFVKPAHLGSSIAITRVESKNDLENAIEVALHYDDRCIVEESVKNLVEVTVPIIGNEELQTAMAEQPLLNQEEFFDFTTKYMQGGKKGGKLAPKGAKRGSQGYSKIPADLPEELYKESLLVAQKAYKAINCEGISRVDLLIDTKAKKVYFNEINPLPGSLYEHNWRQAGVSNVQLVQKLIDLALERHAEQQKLATTFKSSFLQQF